MVRNRNVITSYSTGGSGVMDKCCGATVPCTSKYLEVHFGYASCSLTHSFVITASPFDR